MLGLLKWGLGAIGGVEREVSRRAPRVALKSEVSEKKGEG